METRVIEGVFPVEAQRFINENIKAGFVIDLLQGLDDGLLTVRMKPYQNENGLIGWLRETNELYLKFNRGKDERIKQLEAEIHELKEDNPDNTKESTCVEWYGNKYYLEISLKDLCVIQEGKSHPCLRINAKKVISYRPENIEIGK